MRGVPQLADDSAWTQIKTHLPAWAVLGVTALLALSWLLTQLAPLTGPARRVADVFALLLRRPSGKTAERVKQRRTVARYVERRLTALAQATRWDDAHYAELSAGVSIDGGRERVWPWWPGSPSRLRSVRRERSLLRGLAGSTENIVLLQGDPGSGKSVALRHLARELAHRAARSARPDVVIPLYIDLKGFRPEGEVSSDAVLAYVFDSLTRVKDAEIRRILVDEGELDRGLRDGTWLLLFDSFDEIPAVLSATESDDVVRSYADALFTFADVRNCRTVIASREYRGPPSFRLPLFTIDPLTTRRQHRLIRRADLTTEQRRIAFSGIAQADAGIQEMAANPLFLWLLCEYVRVHKGFPENAHAVFVSYADQRFSIDSSRIADQFGLSAEQLRLHTEDIAFTMASRPALGIDPSQAELRAAVAERDPDFPFDRVMAALTSLRLGRDSATAEDLHQSRFTFTHRRLQEYFATCAVLRDPDQVSLTELLTSGRWRETAITILQLQTGESSLPLLQEAIRLLTELTGLTGLTELTETAPSDDDSSVFTWPRGMLHLLDVVLIGFSRAPDLVPDELREIVGPTIVRAWKQGRRHEKLWAVESALAAPEAAAVEVLTGAFDSPSGLLCEAAFRQTARLRDPSADLRVGLQRSLLLMSVSGRLAQDGAAVRTQLRRFRQTRALVNCYWLMRSLNTVDILLLGLLAPLLSTRVLMARPAPWPATITALLIAHIGLRLRTFGLAGAVVFERQPFAVRWGGLLVRSPQARVVVGRLSRFAVLSLAVAGAVRYAQGAAAAVVVICCTLYAFTWANAALSQIAHGRVGSVVWWPLLSVRALVRPTLKGRDGWVITAAAVLAGLLAAAALAGAVVAVFTGLGVALRWLWTAAGLRWLLVGIGHAIAWLFGWLLAVGRFVKDLFTGLHLPSWLLAIGHGTTWILKALTYVLAGAVLATIPAALLILLALKIVTAAKSRRAIREVSRRTAPYEVAEIWQTLRTFETGRAVLLYVQTLRSHPELCGADIVALISDFGAAAELGGHTEHRPEHYVGKGAARRRIAAIPSVVRMPAGHGEDFELWVRAYRDHAAMLLNRVGEEAVDEIARFVSECRRTEA